MPVDGASDDHGDLDRIGYLFGYPIAHSMSPLLHKTVYNGLGLNWAQLPLESTDIDAFLALAKHEKFYGASVTMPHKVAILPRLDALTQEAQDVGACNTVFLRTHPETGERILVGTNTDVIGVRDAFAHNVADTDALFTGRPVLVVGGGGAARSAVYALRRFTRATDIYLVNRDREEAAAVIMECTARGYGSSLRHVVEIPDAQDLSPPSAIIACVPNLPPETAEEKRARAVLEVFLAKASHGVLLEMCYHPVPWTEIAELASKAGWQVILGTEAMIYQGLEQDKYWTNKAISEMPVSAVKTAIAVELAQATTVQHPTA